MNRYTSLLLLFLSMIPLSLRAQTEVMAWGNITGIRVDGHLMAFESFLTVGDKNMDKTSFSGKEKQPHPLYHREGLKQIVTTDLRGVNFKQEVTDTGPGTVQVRITSTCDTATPSHNAWLAIKLDNCSYHISGRNLVLKNQEVTLTLSFTRRPTLVSKGDLIFILLLSELKKGRSATLEFNLCARGLIDKDPVT
ncbi:MAG TPA: hypothetical protein PLM68_07250, partial [Bacteroidales bacterium]|nr:hypothetical protein [Bacteroidales bacterium]